MRILQHPIATEKSIRMIEAENKLVFVVAKEANKANIKKAFEKDFEVKVKAVNTTIKNGKKYAFIKLRPEFQALDVATKLGMM